MSYHDIAKLNFDIQNIFWGAWSSESISCVVTRKMYFGALRRSEGLRRDVRLRSQAAPPRFAQLLKLLRLPRIAASFDGYQGWKYKNAVMASSCLQVRSSKACGQRGMRPSFGETTYSLLFKK